jgi:Zn-dependent protease/predicted transcriptional regulator
MKSGFHLARLAGIDVRVDWSLAIIFTLILALLGLTVFPAWHPDWGPALVWTTAFGAAVLFFTSVLLHEMAHALVGRRMGVVINRITLFIFGGMAHIEHEPDKWRSELWMAAAGPAASFAIGFGCLLLAGLLTGPLELDPEEPARALAALGPLPTLLVWLGQVNILLAIFNLVPGFPLDGGRVLRALLWAYTGSVRKATRLASAAGQAFAWLLIGVGFAMILGFRFPVLGGGLVGGIWLAFIGWFLNNAAFVSYRQLLAREALEGVPVSRVMQTRLETADPAESLRELIEERMVQSGQRAFPVVERERLVGMVCLRDLQKLDPAQRAMARVRDVMTPAERLVRARPGEDAFEALARLSHHNLNQLPVVEGDRLKGMLRREDLLNWLALHTVDDEQPVGSRTD